MPVGDNYTLVLNCSDAESGEKLGRVSLWNVEKEDVEGHVALLSHPLPGSGPARFWFSNWSLKGSKVEQSIPGGIGPVICAWHSISHGSLRITAQTMPVTAPDARVLLQFLEEAEWKTRDVSPINRENYTAQFHLKHWDASNDMHYRLVCDKSGDRAQSLFSPWTGTVPREPEQGSPLVLAILEDATNLEGDARLTSIAASHPNLLVLGGSPWKGATVVDDPDDLHDLYSWCLTYRSIMTNAACLGISYDSATYARIRVATTEEEIARLEADTSSDWSDWMGADLKLNISTGLFHDVAVRYGSPEAENGRGRKSKNREQGAMEACTNAALLHLNDGFGVVRLDATAGNLTFERRSWGRENSPEPTHIPGWPITVDHCIAFSRRPLAYLPAIRTDGIARPVFQVIDESSGEMIYSLRAEESVFLPRVFHDAAYSVLTGDPDTGRQKVLTGLNPVPPTETGAIVVDFFNENE